MEELIIHTDGACRGNPGPAAVGITFDRQGKRIKEISKAIGQATNNIAEYTALIYALQEALILKADKIRVFTDSELMFKQVTGQYKVKDIKIKPLFEQIQHLKQGFQDFEIQHVPREQNQDADRLATQPFKKEAGQDGCTAV